MYPLKAPSPPNHLGSTVPKSRNLQHESRRAFLSITSNNSRSKSTCKFALTSLSPSLSLSTSSSSSTSLRGCVRTKKDQLKINMALVDNHMDPQQDDRLSRIAKTIRVIPDFPKPGVMFQDITTMLLDPKAFKDTVDLFVERYKNQHISVVAGVEARGFIFGPPIALAIGAKFVPLRKPGKLPGEVISEEYSLEYGTDTMEMHVGAVEAGERAIVVDDLVATGGTLCAAIKLLDRVGVKVVESACVIELPELKGRERLGDNPLFVLIKPA